MGLSKSIGNFVDGVVSIVNPRKGLQRKFFRSVYDARAKHARRSQYAAAKTDRLTGSWNPTNDSVNSIIGASASTVRARVRQLVRDFPYFTRAVNIICDYTVGAGIQLQSKIKDPNGNIDKMRSQKVEDAFNFWAEQADISGKLHFYEMMELAKRQDVESGEFLLIKRFPKTRNRYLPYALQIIESDWLTDLNAQASSKANEIEQGIEYNRNTGQVIRYHFADPERYGDTSTIRADQVIMGFKTLRPGQLRGISPFTPGVLLAGDLHELMQTEMDINKLASKYLAFVESPDLAGNQSLLQTAEDSDNTDNKIMEVETALVEYLAPGEKVTFAHSNRPGTTFDPFVRLILRMLSITTNIPYELLSGDYSGMNYSTGRTSRNDFATILRPISVRHVRHFATPAFYEFMDNAALMGRLDFPNYFANPVPYVQSEWQPPGMESIDPLRETKAHVDQINSLIRSPQEIVKARGRDWEDVVREISVAKQTAKQLDLDFGDSSTAVANNPAAVSDDQRSELQDIIDQLTERVQ